MPKRKSKRGFASMDKERQLQIASLGGRRATELGKAHRWTSEEASLAGKIGGKASKKGKKYKKITAN